MKRTLYVSMMLAATTGLWVAACSGGGTSSTTAGTGGGGTGGSGGGDPVAVARGQYLVDHLLVCSECHTPVGPDGKPDNTKYLAGSRSYDFTTKDGEVISVYAENLTSHKIEGIGAWKDEWVTGAVTKGIDDENIALWPIMPYPEYALMKPEDVKSILAYLRTVPANSNVVAPDTKPDPDPPAKPIDESKIPHTTLADSDPDHAAAERGRYLATIACVNCHTPEISPGIPDLSKAFAGGRTYRSRSDTGYSTSTNLTPDDTGLAGWTVADIADSIKTNTEKGTARELCSTMPGGPGRMGELVDGDLKDLATYIHSIPPLKNGPFKCDMEVPDGGAGDGG
jgi:mono/diheme cytochrome c family protein